MDRISRIQNPKALHVVQLIIIIVKQIYWKGEKQIKKNWLVGCFDMDASPEFCFPPSIDARAVFFSFVGLGFVTPISPFLCVIGWIWCFSVDTAITYMSFLSLSLHDACVISFSLTHTHTYTTLLHQILSSGLLLTLYIHYEIRSLIHSFPLTPILSNSHIHSPIPTSSLFLFLLQKHPNHAPCIHPISTAWQHQSFFYYSYYSSIPSSQQQAVVPSTTPTTRM